MSIEFKKIANQSCSFIQENNNIVIKTPLKNDIYFGNTLTKYNDVNELIYRNTTSAFICGTEKKVKSAFINTNWCGTEPRGKLHNEWCGTDIPIPFIDNKMKPYVEYLTELKTILNTATITECTKMDKCFELKTGLQITIPINHLVIISLVKKYADIFELVKTTFTNNEEIVIMAYKKTNNEKTDNFPIYRGEDILTVKLLKERQIEWPKPVICTFSNLKRKNNETSEDLPDNKKQKKSFLHSEYGELN